MSEQWLAGFFDGEGCLTFYKQRRTHFTPVASVANTNLKVLEEIQREFGGRIHSKGTRKDWTPSFNLVWAGSKQVEALLDRIEPFIFLKQPEVQVMRKWFEATSRVKTGRPKALPDTEILLRESLKQELSDLKSRSKLKKIKG